MMMMMMMMMVMMMMMMAWGLVPGTWGSGKTWGGPGNASCTFFFTFFFFKNDIT